MGKTSKFQCILVLILWSTILFGIYFACDNKRQDILAKAEALEQQSLVLDEESSLELAQAHAQYVETRYSLLKKLYQADSTTFVEYALLVFWEEKATFPDNVSFKESLREKINEHPSLIDFAKKETKAWEEFKKVEEKFR